MRNDTVLVIDDTKALLAAIEMSLQEEGYTVLTAQSAEEALAYIGVKNVDACVMDIQMPGMNGLDALLEIKRKDPKLPVILMTAYGTTQTAIEAMKRGAYEYITKPFKNDEFKVMVKHAVEASRLMREAVHYQEQENTAPVDGIYLIGKSAPMLEIYKTIGQVADTSATVLIRGESGTGKELVARAIYQNSSRRDKPFLAINCAAIPETLLEAELFGYEKGAFTGAVNKRVGKFQQCDSGTILLDEIGDMALATQTKILRVLQEQTFEPVGSTATVKVDVRVIASTNKDLWKAIQDGSFREDLYYRLKVVTIFLPPLRQRKEDIPLLVEYFIRKFNKTFKRSVQKVSDEIMRMLIENDWPGNVRELENAVQTAIVMSKKDILSFDEFPALAMRNTDVPQSGPGMRSDCYKLFHDSFQPILREAISVHKDRLYKHIIGAMEKVLIELVLKETEGNQIQAAHMLGISRNTLRSRMEEFSL